MGAKVSKLWDFHHNGRRDADVIQAGDICGFTGMDDVQIGDTVVDAGDPRPMPPLIVEEPTVVMEFGINTSPFAGQLEESKFLTGTQLKTRLERESMTNLAIRVEPGRNMDSFRVKGRGTLQLGILIENLRREGFELMIGPPEVFVQIDEETGEKQEPYEEVVVDVPTEYQGVVMEEMSKKKAELNSMDPGSVENTTILNFRIPTRNLIGVNGILLRRCKGEAVLTSRFLEFGEYQGDDLRFREAGSIVSADDGKATAYTLCKHKNKGSFWVKPRDDVYQGMVLGIHNKEMELTISITKERGGGRKDVTTGVDVPPAPLQMDIDDFLGHMDTDELLEITPGPIRLVKRNSKVLKAK